MKLKKKTIKQKTNIIKTNEENPQQSCAQTFTSNRTADNGRNMSKKWKKSFFCQIKWNLRFQFLDYFFTFVFE